MVHNSTGGSRERQRKQALHTNNPLCVFLILQNRSKLKILAVSKSQPVSMTLDLKLCLKSHFFLNSGGLDKNLCQMAHMDMRLKPALLAMRGLCKERLYGS